MKFVVVGDGAGMPMEEILKIYPRHKAFMEPFAARAELIGAGPLADDGNMAIFATREAAEIFAAQDPFLLEGVVRSYAIREWKDTMIPEPTKR